MAVRGRNWLAGGPRGYPACPTQGANRGRCDAKCGSWGDLWCGDKFLFRFGLRGWREILCRKQVDHLGASGEAAELDVDAGVGQRQDGFIELEREGARVLAERQELEQFGCGAGPVERAIPEGADRIDEGVGRGRGVEGFEHFPRGAVQGGGGGLGPSAGGGMAGVGWLGKWLTG